MFYEIIINGNSMYYLDGYYYTLDTIPFECLFDSVTIQYPRPE